MLEYDIDLKIGRTRRFYLSYTNIDKADMDAYGYQTSNDFNDCPVLNKYSSDKSLELFREKIKKYLC